MRTIVLLSIFSIAIASGGCSKPGAPPVTSGAGMTDTGGGTMNNPTGIEGAAGTSGAATETAGTATAPRSTEVVTPPGTGSLSSTAGPEGGEAGGGTAAASPANPHGTGTGTTTP